MKTERESLENKLTNEINIIRNEINKIKVECESNLQFQEMKFGKQNLEFENKILIKK